MPLKLAGEARAGATTRVLDVRSAHDVFVFEDVAEAPVPSLLRGFSAPVKLTTLRSDDELAADIAYLRKTWATIRERNLVSGAGTLLHEDLNLAQRVLRDLVNEETQSIRIDSQLQFDTLRAFGQAFTPTSVNQLALYKGERPIFDLYNIDQEIERALARRVELKSGGYLIRPA